MATESRKIIEDVRGLRAVEIATPVCRGYQRRFFECIERVDGTQVGDASVLHVSVNELDETTLRKRAGLIAPLDPHLLTYAREARVSSTLVERMLDLMGVPTLLIT
jgi:hypothetical protein